MKIEGLIIMLIGIARFAFALPTVYGVDNYWTLEYFLHIVNVLSQLLLAISGYALQYYKRWAIFTGLIVSIYSIVLSLMFLRIGNLDILSVFVLFIILYCIYSPRYRDKIKTARGLNKKGVRSTLDP